MNCNTKNYKKLEERDMKEFCKKVFTDLSQNISSLSWLHVILAPTNKEVDTINDLLDQIVPCWSSLFSSADQVVDTRDLPRSSVELLNSLCPSCFPQNILSSKTWMAIMLSRYISPQSRQDWYSSDVSTINFFSARYQVKLKRCSFWELSSYLNLEINHSIGPGISFLQD